MLAGRAHYESWRVSWLRGFRPGSVESVKRMHSEQHACCEKVSSQGPLKNRSHACSALVFRARYSPFPVSWACTFSDDISVEEVRL